MARQYDFIKLDMGTERFEWLLSAIDFYTERCNDVLKNEKRYDLTEEDKQRLIIEIHKNNKLKENLISHCKKYIKEKNEMSIFKNELVSLFEILLGNYYDLARYKERSELLEKRVELYEQYLDEDYCDKKEGEINATEQE